MYNDKRTASIRALQNVSVWVLDGQIFKKIQVISRRERRETELYFLDKVDIFRNLDRYEKLSLLDGLQVKTFKKGEVIVREGDFGDHFYIVEDGHVECLNKAKRPDGYIVEFVIRKLTSGDHFGELALINNEKRTLTVRCGSPEVKLLSLDRATFDRILGQITNFLNRDYSDLMMPSRICSTDRISFGSQTKTPSFMRRSSINISMGQL